MSFKDDFPLISFFLLGICGFVCCDWSHIFTMMSVEAQVSLYINIRSGHIQILFDGSQSWASVWKWMIDNWPAMAWSPKRAACISSNPHSNEMSWDRSRCARAPVNDFRVWKWFCNFHSFSRRRDTPYYYPVIATFIASNSNRTFFLFVIFMKCTLH